MLSIRLLLDSGAAEAASTAPGIRKAAALLPLDALVARKHELGDALPFLYDELLGTQVHEYHAIPAASAVAYCGSSLPLRFITLTFIVLTY